MSGRGTESFVGRDERLHGEQQKLDNTVVEKAVARRAGTWAIVNMKTTVNRLDTKKRSVNNRNYKVHYCSWQTTTNGCRNPDKMLRNITSVYLGTELNVGKALSRSCNRRVFVLIPFSS